jgi:excinuclease UvrABC nuclease subunit
MAVGMTTQIVFHDPLPKRGRWDTVRVNFDDVVRFSGPGVYVFYMDKVPLYVGSGKSVMGRCMSAIHHRADIRRMATWIEIRPCPTHEMALRLEEKMIAYLNPRCNKQKTTISRRMDKTYAY